MHVMHSLSQLLEAVPGPNLSGQRVFEQRQSDLQGLTGGVSQRTLWKAFSRRVNRQHHSGMNKLVCSAADDLILGILELRLLAESLHLAAERQRRSGLESICQVGLIEPRGLDDPRVVAQDHERSPAANPFSG